MRKQFRRITAMLLTVVMITLIIPFGVMSIDAAKTEESVGATQKAMFIMDTINISQGMYGSYSHQGSKAIDLTGRDGGIDPAYAPFDGKVVYMSTSAAYIIYQSLNPVEFADGTVDYMTVWVMHDDNVGRFSIGQTFSQGQHFFNEGSSGYATGNHIHLECARGTYQGQYKNSYGVWCINNQINPYDALYLSNSTEIINGYGYNWRRTNPTPYARPAISRSYINYQQSGSYRVNVEVTNAESVSSVRVATWTQQDQSDLHWNYCYYNGYGTYFIDLSRSDFASNQTNYCNDIYVYDTRGECVGYERIGTIYDTPAIVRSYINLQLLDTYRVNVEVTNAESISSVRVATWTQADQSDLHWNYCHYNGYGTYFIDLSRSDFATNQMEYCNDVYVYDGNGNCVDYERVGTIYTTPKIEDIRVSKVSQNGFRVSCKMDSQFGVASAQMAVWTEINGQDDLVWHKASVSGNYVSCYINSSEHKNELDKYIVHLYVGDEIGQSSAFTGILPYINLSDDCNVISSVYSKNSKYVLFNHDFSWTEAKAWCENQGGHLVTIEDESEWNMVKYLLSESGGFPVWLGAENTSGTWRWVTGENMSYSDWEEFQPDNYDGVEHYLGTHNFDNYLDCYKWNDYKINPTYVGGFICEFDDYFKTGDTNLDGNIDIRDVTAIQRHLVELEKFNDEQLAVADTNGDGEINIADATHLQMYLAEYDVVLGKQN